MKIESYDPYHIGLKLSNVNLQIFRQKVIKTMKSIDLQVVAKDEMPFNVPTEILTSEGETRIELNYSTNSINTIGNDPKQTNQLFLRLLKVLTTIGYELDSLVAFYDLQTNINVKLDKDPLELINNSVHCDLSSWREINSNVKVQGLKIEYFDKETSKDSFKLTVLPNPVRPKNYLIISISYQHIEDDKIIDFGNKIEERVLSFIGAMEKKND